MSTGLESVDEQHRALIALLNGLVAAMEDGRASREVGAIIDDLGRYVRGHFSYEEECMERYECPVAAVNAREHREFARILADFSAEFEAKGGSAALVLRVENQLAWWLENHILEVDVELRPCVRAAERERSAAGQA